MKRELISVSGFYYTGSSAVIDLLKEFKNIQVLGFSDDTFDMTEKYAFPNHEFGLHAKLDVNKIFREFLLGRKAGFDVGVKKWLFSEKYGTIL